MRVFFRRSQRRGGVFSSAPIFALDAHIELTSEENQLIETYQLYKEILYSSEAAKRHGAELAETVSHTGLRGLAKAAMSRAMYELSLKCTVQSLIKGQNIECKDLGELVAAEAAITEAAQTLKGYLEVAVTFDGREEIIEI